MKLEFKHILHYYPHGLSVIVPEKSKVLIGVIHSIDDISDKGEEELTIDFPGNGHYQCLSSDVTPILRGKEEFNRKIYHNNKWVFPLDDVAAKAWQTASENFDSIEGAKQWAKTTWDINSQGEEGLMHLPFWMIEMLLEWNFDVFDLIPNGLALDMGEV